jgi:hypothetical protein
MIGHCGYKLSRAEWTPEVVHRAFMLARLHSPFDQNSDERSSGLSLTPDLLAPLIDSNGAHIGRR